MEKRATTIYNVAREANVSIATASRVASDNPNVRPVTCRKVLEVIDHLNYHPNVVARGLTSGKTTAIGVVILNVSNAFSASLTRGIGDVTIMYKYNITLASSNGDDRKEVIVLNNLFTKQVDGIIFTGHRVINDIRGEFLRSEAPVVLTGSTDPDEQAGSTDIDHTETMEDATAALAKNGNKKIAFASGVLIDPINGQNRIGDYGGALAENGLSYSEGLVFESEYKLKAGTNLAERARGSGTIAALVTDDELTISLLDRMLDVSVKAPEGFEIVTSNNPLLTEVFRLRLSNITRPLYDIGTVSMRSLAKLVNKEGIEEKTVVLSYGINQKGSIK